MKLNKIIKFNAAAIAAAAMLVCASPAMAMEKSVVPMGNSIGITMSTPGVFVSALSAAENGSAPSPAGKAGLLPGDLITAVNGEDIGSGDDFKAAVQKLDGSEVSLTVLRDGEEKTFAVTPDTASGGIEFGLLLRDGVTGVGTMTYYDPETGCFGGLGHSISDTDSGENIPFGSGNIMHSVVVEVVKGEAGKPGQLHGVFDQNSVWGSMLGNTPCGIFGKLTKDIPDASGAFQMADESEIKTGRAEILANVDGDGVGRYEIEIERVYNDDESGRSMMIKITDEKLKQITGGIVQGMSGSPVLQNGKLVGAVTHVLVSDPERGFAVSAKKMLKESDGLIFEGNAA